ncbi:MAG TPA: ATP synthase subunit I [Bryobacteraceae bacterium]|nr:ATP synthase subunit I [Bryobacteraceae bacterium]
MFRLTQLMSAAGVAAYFAAGGWRAGLGFLLGALISYLNFRWLKRTVDALGALEGAKTPSARVAVLLGLRYLLLGLGAYAIVKFSEISLTAALVGLFMPALAVILEILIELFYART